MKRQQVTGALLLAIAAAYLGIAWAGWMTPLLFLAIALTCYGMVVLAAKLNWPVWLVAPATIIGVTFGSTAFAAWRTGTDAITTARDLVPRLLSAPYPAPATMDMLAPGVILVTVVAVGCAIRVTRGGWLAGLVAVAVLYLAGATLSGGRADPHGLVAGALLAATVSGWLLDEVTRPTGADTPDEPTGRKAFSAGLRLAMVRSAPVLGVMVAVMLLAAYFPGVQPFEPRLAMPRPIQLLTEANPLSRVAIWNRDGNSELMRVGAEQPPTLRLVALNDFTGDAWLAGGCYTSVGSNVVDPADQALPAGKRRATVDLEVTLTIGLGGHWLPTPGLADATSLTDALLHPASGALARPEGGPAGLRYRVRADIDVPDPVDLPKATVHTGQVMARYLGTPRLPASLAELARTTVLGTRTPYERAVRIEEELRRGRFHDPAAPAGSSYARLVEFLKPGGAGTAEHFASSFAVIARSVGLPSRIVVGFRPVERDDRGYWIVRGRDAAAWAEVYFTDAGWVPFDPRPGPSSVVKR